MKAHDFLRGLRGSGYRAKNHTPFAEASEKSDRERKRETERGRERQRETERERERLALKLLDVDSAYVGAWEGPTLEAARSLCYNPH